MRTTKRIVPKLTPNQIRSLRKRLGLSQEALANELGLVPSAVAQWEMGVTSPSATSRTVLHGLAKKIPK